MCILFFNNSPANFFFFKHKICTLRMHHTATCSTNCMFLSCELTNRGLVNVITLWLVFVLQCGKSLAGSLDLKLILLNRLAPNVALCFFTCLVKYLTNLCNVCIRWSCLRLGYYTCTCTLVWCVCVCVCVCVHSTFQLVSNRVVL